MSRALKLLHVEDDPADAHFMKRMLQEQSENEHYDITHVEDMQAAILETRNHPYDAILLDLNLSNDYGLENITALQEQNPNLPLIVLSGLDSEKTALEAINCGAQEYLVKGDHKTASKVRHAIHASIKRKERERALFKQANYDTLTGLPNRKLFQDYVERALKSTKRWNRQKALMFLDINDFKAINDTHGHLIGDAVLKEAALRLVTSLRDCDIVARYAGDEFVIMLDDHIAEHQLVGISVSLKILHALEEPMVFGDLRISVSASIGIAIFPTHDSSFAALINKADQAMYQAKQNENPSFCFAPFESSTTATKETSLLAAPS